MTSAIGGLDYEHLKYIPYRNRKIAKRSVAWAILAAKLSPDDLGREIDNSILSFETATIPQVKESRNVILSYSYRLHGSYCLPRALAVLHYCDSCYKTRPQVIIGARVDPFQAHAWLRAEGQVIDEFEVNKYFQQLRVY